MSIQFFHITPAAFMADSAGPGQSCPVILEAILIVRFRPEI